MHPPPRVTPLPPMWQLRSSTQTLHPGCNTSLSKRRRFIRDHTAKLLQIQQTLLTTGCPQQAGWNARARCARNRQTRCGVNRGGNRSCGATFLESSENNHE